MIGLACSRRSSPALSYFLRARHGSRGQITAHLYRSPSWSPAATLGEKNVFHFPMQISAISINTSRHELSQTAYLTAVILALQLYYS